MSFEFNRMADLKKTYHVPSFVPRKGVLVPHDSTKLEEYLELRKGDGTIEMYSRENRIVTLNFPEGTSQRKILRIYSEMKRRFQATESEPSTSSLLKF